VLALARSSYGIYYPSCPVSPQAPPDESRHDSGPTLLSAKYCSADPIFLSRVIALGPSPSELVRGSALEMPPFAKITGKFSRTRPSKDGSYGLLRTGRGSVITGSSPAVGLRATRPTLRCQTCGTDCLVQLQRPVRFSAAHWEHGGVNFGAFVPHYNTSLGLEPKSSAWLASRALTPCVKISVRSLPATDG
jgi:hypothetical protein